MPRIAIVDGQNCVDPRNRYPVCVTAQLVKREYALMYGNEEERDDNDHSSEKGVKLISTGDEIEEALQNANSIVLVCYDTPITNIYLDTILESVTESNLSQIVMISKMGASKKIGGGGGFFGGGGGNGRSLSACEDAIKTMAASRNLDLSIVRAGVLKGGGPGGRSIHDQISMAKKKKGWCLDRSYYGKIADLSEFSCTQAHDQFSLSATASTITAGDAIALPNMFQQAGTKSSFEARPYDTNRIVLASSVVASLLLSEKNKKESKEKQVSNAQMKKTKISEYSVGAARGEKLPTIDEW
eukprot:CAMPEP_0113323940 /NCGR_PEP_ID=MMETSP0010_2-20120614/16690_1 /TAXON_ID=216773 ORGANISM="Corethron hystrix, Strain 308" /NCGR_SAMPLE_ID=MMETSP0010_2 /ASSEMBLY_ACC=CAM_ASM_000155 /LENGTH=298 /DNA_ID=CAMNT_0000183107 /DNA_START=89 /DNA_END=983 /DNA_ORIENTATION=+ /assembly_acc=CAM_ASM_000155